MIRKIKYSQIDFEKYENCLKNSVQDNFYAHKFNLDHLCESWEILVYGDYEFVMPVPTKKKYGFQFVITPLFCQQLGIFGPENNSLIEKKFLKYFLRKYRILYYSFNFRNSFSDNLRKKKNYIINNVSYDTLRKNYFKGRKSTVKTTQNLIFNEVNLDQNLDFLRTNFKGLTKKKDVEKFFSYLQFLNAQNLLKLYAAFKDDQIISIATVITQENQLSLLGLVNDEQFKKDNGASFLIDAILKQNIDQISFNFMGSSIRGIEVFFKSFGSKLQEYAVVENSKKDLIKNLLRKP